MVNLHRWSNINLNKVHFVKITGLMNQKFAAAVAISEQLIHTAYNHHLAAGALHQEALLKINTYINKVGGVGFH